MACRQGGRVSGLASLFLLSGLAIAALQAAPVRSVTVAEEVPVTFPKPGETGALGGIIGGGVGQIVTEIEQAKARHSVPLPQGDFGAAKSLRSAVINKLRQKRLFAERGKADAELRLLITQFGLVPPRGAVFSKNVTPFVGVRAILVNESGKIIWEDRRHSFSFNAPKFSKAQVIANPNIVNAAVDKLAQRLAQEIVQTLVTPGSGHQWDAIRRDYDPLPGSRAKKNN